MMHNSALLESIALFAGQTPRAIALEGDTVELSYRSLLAEVEEMAAQLQRLEIDRLALMMDNGPAWVIVDLACQQAGITLVPIPAFFSPAQIEHALRDAAVDIILCDDARRLVEQLPAGSGGASIRPLNKTVGQSCWLVILPSPPERPPLSGIAKVTYTSGTTGTAKGVCLTQASMEAVAASLAAMIGVASEDRHLCLLPLPVLLENVAGVYAPLLRGATCVVPGLAAVGLMGAGAVDPGKMYRAIVDRRATSIILLPEMLRVLVALLQAGAERPQALRFAAVGGAPVSERLLSQADNLGLPVYEGYGLSESASVVAVNTPAHRRIGSVGKVLPHLQVRFSAENEIQILGNKFAGYIHESGQDEDEWLASGDLGYMDDDGYLYLNGRIKNCFITSFGRNVAPEWVERELTVSPLIAQAVVFGEAKPFNVALIVPTDREGYAKEAIDAAVEAANRQLPDYARIRQWCLADAPFSVDNQQYTATGRPRREVIHSVYGPRIDALYADTAVSPDETEEQRSRHAIL